MAVPDSQQLVVQGFSLESKFFGSIDKIVVNLDKDTGADFDVLKLLVGAVVSDTERRATAANLVRLLKDCDRVLEVLAREQRLIEQLVEVEGC